MKKDESAGSKDKIFDRIFKENAYMFMPVIGLVLGINIKSYKILPSELPRTIGKELIFCAYSD